MGWETEDFLDGNKLAKTKKNVSNTHGSTATAKLRASLHLSDRNRNRNIDKDELMRADEDDARDGAGNSNPVTAAAHMSEQEQVNKDGNSPFCVRMRMRMISFVG
mmetsp:Transcript_13346/g.20604  ORF Transcript_13346/g.20604 Transcript_13346/m.20604 type:complete len:105 (-) Transcript_13346:87-401(-)